MVIAVRQPTYVRYATVRVVPHSVALGQQRCLTVNMQMSKYKGVVIGVLPVGHQNLSTDGLNVPGDITSALYNGCSWYTRYDGSGSSFTAADFAVPPLALAVAMR